MYAEFSNRTHLLLRDAGANFFSIPIAQFPRVLFVSIDFECLYLYGWITHITLVFVAWFFALSDRTRILVA